MRKFMKSLLLTGVCASMIASGFAFADTSSTAGFRPMGAPPSMQGNGPGSQQMMEAGPEGEALEEGVTREELEAAHQEALLEIVDTYASDLYDDFEDAFAENTELQEELQDLMEATKLSDDTMDDLKAAMDAIQEQVESGELTREEAMEAMKELMPERPAMNTDEQQAPPEGDEQQAPPQGDQQPQVQQEDSPQALLEAAIAEDNEDAIVEILEDMLDQLLERNEALVAQIEDME